MTEYIYPDFDDIGWGARPLTPDEAAADVFNQKAPVGTPVTYWPGERKGPGRESRTRSKAWVMASGQAVVSVEGYPGGIALTHVKKGIS